MKRLAPVLIALFALAACLKAAPLGAAEDIRQMYQAASDHLNAGELEEAKNKFTELTLIKPDFAAAFHSLGVVYFQLGYLDLAIENIEKASALGLKDAKSMYLLGLCYSRKGQDEEALTSYLNAIQIDPNFMSAYHSAGLTYYQMGEWSDARDMLNKALELSPGNDRVMFVLGLAYLKNKQPEHTIDMITALRQIHQETKAAKLESLMRPPPESYEPLEPPPALFEPDLPQQIPPQMPRTQGTITITGKAQIQMQGIPPEEEGGEEEYEE